MSRFGQFLLIAMLLCASPVRSVLAIGAPKAMNSHAIVDPMFDEHVISDTGDCSSPSQSADTLEDMDEAVFVAIRATLNAHTHDPSPIVNTLAPQSARSLTTPPPNFG